MIRAALVLFAVVECVWYFQGGSAWNLNAALANLMAAVGLDLINTAIHGWCKR